MLTDPKPVGESDAICVQYVQTVEKPNCWVKTILGSIKSLYWHNNVKLSCRDLPKGILWFIL